MHPSLSHSDSVAHSDNELAEAPRMNLEINRSFKCNQCPFNIKNKRVPEKMPTHSCA